MPLKAEPLKCIGKNIFIWRDTFLLSSGELRMGSGVNKSNILFKQPKCLGKSLDHFNLVHFNSYALSLKMMLSLSPPTSPPLPDNSCYTE